MNDLDKKLLEFSINFYGEARPFNQTISVARCGIFYKGGNRNGTYITDEFANKLISSLPYTPIKGIYNYDDFEGHRDPTEKGKIFGIVPQEPNFAWETHLDEDGIEREYACTDVLLYTALYKEANEIVGKGQSMELYKPAMKGDWEIIDGKKFFVFSDGCFLGLQVLGDDVKPCFEGAGFYSLFDSLTKLFEEVKNYAVQNEKKDKGGNKNMVKFIYNLSDADKRYLLFNAINGIDPEGEEEEFDYWIESIYEDYFIAYNCKEHKIYKVNYTKDDEANTVTLGDKEEVFAEYVSEEELTALHALRALNNNSYNNVKEVYELGQKYNDLESEFNTKKDEYSSEITTLKGERDTAEANYEALVNENKELSNFKAESERKEKESIINTYSLKLGQDTLDSFNENIDNYDAESLEKELAYALVKEDPSIFNDSSKDSDKFPSNSHKSGIEGILDKYNN